MSVAIADTGLINQLSSLNATLAFALYGWTEIVGMAYDSMVNIGNAIWQWRSVLAFLCVTQIYE
jgi:hypothetical protein